MTSGRVQDSPALLPPLDLELGDRLAALGAAHRLRSLTPFRHRRAGTVEDAAGTVYHDFASSDYLGLAGDLRLGQAVTRDVQHDAVGAPGSRVVTGDHPAHHGLELAIADATARPAALLFGSGYLANLGALGALVARDDVIYADALNHAALVDGCRLTRAPVRIIPHLDVEALDAALDADAERFRRKWIVVESVSPVEGDLYPLDALVEVARRHGAHTYVDDAHGVGVLGSTGGGAAELFGVAEALDVISGSLGKAYGTVGGFVTGSVNLVSWLRHRARTFVFTTAPAPALTIAALEALHLARAESWRHARVVELGTRLRVALDVRGVRTAGTVPHLIPVPIGSEGRAVAVGAALRARGYLVGVIRPPMVPDGRARLRLSCSAAHPPAQLSALADAVAAVLHEFPE